MEIAVSEGTGETDGLWWFEQGGIESWGFAFTTEIGQDETQLRQKIVRGKVEPAVEGFSSGVNDGAEMEEGTRPIDDGTHLVLGKDVGFNDEIFAMENLGVGTGEGAGLESGGTGELVRGGGFDEPFVTGAKETAASGFFGFWFVIGTA